MEIECVYEPLIPFKMNGIRSSYPSNADKIILIMFIKDWWKLKVMVFSALTSDEHRPSNKVGNAILGGPLQPNED